MSFRPCLLIPIYNHKDAIRTTVTALARHNLPIFVVDDGSDAATQSVLENLAVEFPLLHLSRLPQNAGKGAAVMHGMRAAHTAGFTHALQIDADGQHDTNDVPRFIECGMARPDAVVCGKPIFDSSVPKCRLYGRYLTHFLVWIETLSFAISDSLCGFRLYPLAQTCALIDTVAIPKRMDFDTGIAVRLAWHGLAFENIATHVIYPQGGLSHFRMLDDNVRMSKMHLRLIFGMLTRLPLLLWRRLAGQPGKRDADEENHWSRLAERGGVLGLRIVFACYRLLGERAAQILLYPVVAYFYVTGGTARRASRAYLRQIHAFTTEPAIAKPKPGWREASVTCWHSRNPAWIN